MEIADKDIKVKNIKNLLQNRKKLLYHNYVNLKKNAKENPFLKIVQHDYDAYFLTKQNEKQAQIKSLTIIHDYLSNLKNNASNINYENTKFEQKQILSKIKDIQNS